MNAVQFARAMSVTHPTVIRWLKAGLVPGAVLVEPIPGMKVWSIPHSALKMARPLAGRKPGKTATKTVAAGYRKAKNHPQ